MQTRPLTRIDPAEEAVRSLPTWPDSALFLLARGVAAELLRRQLPQPAALPIVDATFAAIGAPAIS
jgi:hypothetical protein